MNTWKECLICTGIVLLLVSCSGKTPVTPTVPRSGPEAPSGQSVSGVVPSGVIRFQVSFSAGNGHRAKLAEIQTIDRVTAFIYDRGGTEIKRADLTISGGVASGRVAVPAQDDLRVVLAYFDGSVVRWLGENEDVDVPAGGETEAKTEADYMGTSVTAPDSVEIGEDYTVSWLGRPNVTGYELQEATAADYSGAVTHTSEDTFRVVSGKNKVGLTYYYRARVNTDYGYGPWHSTGSASTGTYDATEGVIIIDVPIPPDEPVEGSGEITVTLPGGATMEFVWIEPGTFLMGSPDTEPDRASDEGPQHEVTISQGFYLGKCEITQAQWEVVMRTTPWVGQDYVQSNPDHPAVYISWNDCQEFIQVLNDAGGEEIYRLPTEAEWEYACRAGTTTGWSFGDDRRKLGDYAWYRVNAWDVGEKYAHAVGTKLANPWGLYDMYGNVWEWCQDWYGSSYSRGSHIDPTGPTTGSFRVMRGGSFSYYPAQNVRSALRSRNSPGGRGYDLGARLLRIK